MTIRLQTQVFDIGIDQEKSWASVIFYSSTFGKTSRGRAGSIGFRTRFI
jgi:hypothetical protein